MSEFVPCLDPNCKGCRWYASKRKAIEKRMEAKEQKREHGPGNIDAARLMVERAASGKA